jgi:hypothetical protein
VSQVAQLPRPLLIALVGAAAVGAFLFATRGGNSSSTTPAPQSHSTAAKQSSHAASSKAQTGSKTGTGSQTSKPGISSGGGTMSASAATTLPAPVQKALDAHKVVVLLFWNRRGVDDRSVKASVDSISTRGGRVAKFTDTLGHLARYTRVTGSTAVTQTPTLLVIDRHRAGEVSTGYLDTTSVDQLVVDALR